MTPVPSEFHTPPGPGLVRGLGLTAAMSVNIANMVGTGIFTLEGGKCRTILTTLESLDGHEEASGPTRPMGVRRFQIGIDHGLIRHLPGSWRSGRREARAHARRRAGRRRRRELRALAQGNGEGAPRYGRHRNPSGAVVFPPPCSILPLLDVVHRLRAATPLPGEVRRGTTECGLA